MSTQRLLIAALVAAPNLFGFFGAPSIEMNDYKWQWQRDLIHIAAQERARKPDIAAVDCGCFSVQLKPDGKEIKVSVNQDPAAVCKSEHYSAVKRGVSQTFMEEASNRRPRNGQEMNLYYNEQFKVLARCIREREGAFDCTFLLNPRGFNDLTAEYKKTFEAFTKNEGK